MTVHVRQDDAGVTVTAPAYRFVWGRADDRFTLTDAAGRTIVAGPLAPLVVTAAGPRPAGSAHTARVTGSRLAVRYPEVGLALRFEDAAVWVEPVEAVLADPVVELYLFGGVADGRAAPGLTHTYLVQPGLCESAAVSPVLNTDVNLDLVSWLGRGTMGADSAIHQQWGLPAHFFCGVSRDAPPNSGRSATDRRSAAFCLGLAELPAADFLLHLGPGRTSPVFRYHADRWGQVPTGPVRLGAELVLTVADDYRAAIRAYYRVLRDTGRVTPARGRRAALATQFNTWGAQCAAGVEGAKFDQDALERVYEEMRASPLRPEMFVVDDKWEGSYGALAHDERRFGGFEKFLDRVRADGHLVGLWAAFLRTNDPGLLGLGMEHVLHDAAGVPIAKGNAFEAAPYYLFDVSQEAVAAALTAAIGTFVARYDPDLVKFDFGYELPALSRAMPADPAYAGERLLGRALDVVVGALRAAKPDLAVMYYALSPLLVDRIDQHCHDDMFLCVDEYAEEGNRRQWFSSLLGELGVPSYGSGGYDWASMPDIWFDTVAAGPIGTLSGVGDDERGGRLTPAVAARHVGLTAIARRTSMFRVDPVSPVTVGAATGARSSSWLRYEADVPVLACLRARDGAAHHAGIGTDADVVVASLTDQPVSDADRVGVVPFGTGTLTLAGRPGTVTYHRLDGSQRAAPAGHHDGALSVPLDGAGDPPVTWIEIVRG
ncbi:hypothetical protein [Actinocatenispora rupis]|uniref:Uncharacterized protein n=1 Tax=Actinocatenispora rupis TaxID=519421 RepID=A0A8J3J051_9ACTN|nr:hypothetical protein [Actinocatenispora rupis]GID09595.1 hypothetical protein Aru02nite_04840 [Actinocatenispora rupis]